MGDSQDLKENKFINLFEIPLIFVKRWWLIALVIILGIIFSIIRSGLIKEKFMSFVEIELRTRNANNITDNMLSNPLGLTDNLYDSYLDNSSKLAEIYAHIAETPMIIDKVIIKNNLQKVYEINSLVNTRSYFRKKLKVDVNDLGLLEIRYEDVDRNLAYQIIKDYIIELENYYKWRSQEIQKSAIDLIKTAMEQINDEIMLAREELKSFQEKHGIFDVNSYAEDLSKQLAELKLKLINAQLEYKFHYSEYINLGRITKIELNTYREKIDIITKEIDNLKNVTNEGQIAYNDLPKLHSEFMTIDTNLKSLYKIYEQLQQYYNVVKLNINRNGESIVVVNEPELAEEKFYPYRSKILVKDLLSAFALSLILCFILEFLERAMKNEADRKLIMEMSNYLLLKKITMPYYNKIRDFINSKIKFKNKNSNQ